VQILKFSVTDAHRQSRHPDQRSASAAYCNIGSAVSPRPQNMLTSRHVTLQYYSRSPKRPGNHFSSPWAEGSMSSIVFVRWHQRTQFQSYLPGGTNVPVSCVKTAEPIDLPFGLWTWVAEESTSSTIFARWRQCGHMGRYIGATWPIRLNRLSAVAMRSYVKLL